VSLGSLRVLLVVLLLSGCWAVGRAFTVELRDSQPGQARGSGAREGRARVSSVPTADLLRGASARPLFRADRRPAEARFNADSAAMPEEQAAPAPPRPALALTGIVRGRRPAAVLSGVPGVEGEVVLRPGDSAGGLRLVRIDGDRAVVHGLDTTWRLTVRNPWP
jgi:hypothetical protein